MRESRPSSLISLFPSLKEKDKASPLTTRIVKYNSTEFFIAIFPARCPGLKETLNGAGVVMTPSPTVKPYLYYFIALYY